MYHLQLERLILGRISDEVHNIGELEDSLCDCDAGVLSLREDLFKLRLSSLSTYNLFKKLYNYTLDIYLPTGKITFASRATVISVT